MTEPQVRIFISSPSDVEHERALLRDIVHSLAQEYLPYFNVQAVLWEEEALTAARSFQAGLLRPSECEIVIVMLWTRLGTPLADDPYGGMTGTEWEFVDAIEASARNAAPEVLVYRKTSPRLVDINSPEAIRDAVADRERLEGFFRTHFFNPDGSFRRAFRQFDSDATFRDLVETQLRKLLNRRISAERRFAAGAADWRGSPFRPGRAYDIGDQRIFTGREVESRDLIAKLDAMSGEGHGLLLVTGPSGAGKSSLVRAGLLPQLRRPFLFSSVSSCRWCLVELQAASDPMLALSRALTESKALGGAFAKLGLPPEPLARLLATEPQIGVAQVRAALDVAESERRAALSDGDGRSQLAIVLDPIDPLLSAEHPSAPSLSLALSALARQDGIWVIATLRSDLLPGLPGLPGLADALSGDGLYRLDPPAPSRIRQILEIPARIAGIEYEDKGSASTTGLADSLESDAGITPHWLPLVQHTLSDLYETALERTEDGALAPVLNLRDYRAIGGLAGAAARRAAEVWQGLPEDARAALPRLCRALIGVDGAGGLRPLPREADLPALLSDPGCAKLLAALIDARLAVVEAREDAAISSTCPTPELGLLGYFREALIQTRDEWWARLRLKDDSERLDAILETPAAAGPDGETRPYDAARWGQYQSTAELAHPALLSQWRPIRDWLADAENRRTLALRSQISRQARLWKRTDCNREHLLGEVGFAAAQGFAEPFADELEPLEREFLDHSRAFIHFERRRNRLTIGSTLGLLLLFASVATYAIWDARHEAALNAGRSQLHEADIAIDRGNTPKAMRLAWEAGPYLPAEAVDRIAHALAGNRLLAIAKPPGGRASRPVAPAFLEDGGAVVTFSRQHGAERWQLTDGRFEPTELLAGPELPIHDLRVAGRGSAAQVLGLGASGIWQLPASAEQPPTWPCGGPEGQDVAIDPSGRFLIVEYATDEKETALCRVDLSQPGDAAWRQVFPEDAIWDLALSPDGARILAASRAGRVLVLDAADGTQLGTLPKEGRFRRPAREVVFSPDGRQIAVATLDEQLYVFDRQGTQLRVLGQIERGGRSVRIHESSVRALAFSPDGSAIVAGDGTGQLVRWNLEEGSAEILGEHDLAIDDVSISPALDPRLGEHLVLSLSQDKTARLWQLESGKPVAVFSHDAAIAKARFTQDGQSVMTASDRDGSARLWSVTPENGLAFRLPQNDHVRAVAVADLGRATDGDTDLLVATASYDGRIGLWTYTPGSQAPVKERTLEGHQDRIRHIAFSPSRRWLASASSDGTARLWELASGEGCRLELSSTPNDCADGGSADCPDVYQVAFSPDEQWLFTASSDAEQPVRVWDAAHCSAVARPEVFADLRSAARALAVAPAARKGMLLAVGDADGGLHLRRLDDSGRWSRLCSIEAHRASIYALSLSSEGRWLAAASRDGRASLVELREDGCGTPRYLDPDAGRLYDVQLAPDGKALVTAAFEAKAHVWSVEGELLAELSGHENRVTSASFSPDGQWIMTASRDGTLAIWKRPQRAQKLPITPYLVMDADLGGITGATFDASGKTVVAGYWSDTALVWRLWNDSAGTDASLVEHWGRERSRLALIEEAARYRDLLRTHPSRDN
ncbi:AAA family ATPase [Thiorhodococcus minor]|uniref:PQQ-binding-like beta-propeller repeat protein n=1 Tax=Thiorhodococcus minor TaxID=57489 RepID=A0A6M0JZC3_9GAMM|nr:AAA family ATPase [Thiorhodococcus minor]NEV62812.1 PQQ-binding-like beta-propeller repeat protein [Thiorhodococcus minor]